MEQNCHTHHQMGHHAGEQIWSSACLMRAKSHVVGASACRGCCHLVDEERVVLLVPKLKRSHVVHRRVAIGDAAVQDGYVHRFHAVKGGRTHKEKAVAVNGRSLTAAPSSCGSNPSSTPPTDDTEVTEAIDHNPR